MAKKKATVMAFNHDAFKERWDFIADPIINSGKDAFRYIPEWRRTQFPCKELMGFVILYRSLPANCRRDYLVATVGEETMYLDVEVEDAGHGLTDDDIADLVRCKVRLSEDGRSFEMGL